MENNQNFKLVIPHGKMADHDFFKCEKCGYTVRMRVLGNTAKCSKCGGTMHRT